MPADSDQTEEEFLKRIRAYYGGRWVFLREHPQPRTPAQIEECRRKVLALYDKHQGDWEAVRREYNEWSEANGL